MLGEVIIAWSNVSGCLEELFTYLADLDNAFVVGVFLEKIRDGQLDEVVTSLAARLEDGPRDAIREWVKLVRAARRQRNDYLHGVYMPLQHADGEEHLYLLGRRALDRQNGTAQPKMTKLLSANLTTLHGELLEIQQAFERVMDDHYPFRVRRSTVV
jgi:hypothetical protein